MTHLRASYALVYSLFGHDSKRIVDPDYLRKVIKARMSLLPDSGSRSSSPSASARKKGYKSGIDGEACRRRREEDLIGIRKDKREETLLNKRRETKTPQPRGGSLWPFIPSMVKELRSLYPHHKPLITAHFKNLFTIGEIGPIDEILTQGVLPRFVHLLSMNDAPNVQLEVLQFLNNFASRSSLHTTVIVQLGLLPTFVNLLNFSSSKDIREEIVFALLIIAGESPDYRDLVLDHGALLPLLAQFELDSTLIMPSLATCCLCCLVRGRPPVNFEKVKPALPVLEQLIYSIDEEIVAEACWALSYLSDSSDNIQAIIEQGLCPKLVELLLYYSALSSLTYPSDAVIEPALQAIGNIVYAGKHVIDNQLLPFLHQLLTHKHKNSIFKDACWTISNITAGNRAEIQAVIDSNIIPPLVQIFLHAELDIKKEVAWVIFRVTSKGSRDNIRYLVDQGCINVLCELLTCPDPKVVSICLEGLENILEVGEADKEMGQHDRVNIFSQRVDECEGWDKIVNLQTHNNNEIYEKAAGIVEKFWPENDNCLDKYAFHGVMSVQSSMEKRLAIMIRQLEAPTRIFG
ncbi:hypothetical protein VNO78_18276 [Psophocarpus tetragonolobus]|uniref:Importin subunit alpha n=1 Tax=Psophocarpus tetragonolobus TaxID=3891 RepID=A0AAN9XLV5_PSOTE